MGAVRRFDWRVPEVPHQTVPANARERELARFQDALDWAGTRLEALKQDTQARLGQVEARIFDPQLLMLDDPEVVEGTRRYIAEHRLSAARAFDWRMLELKERWARASQPTLLDRLNDLEDLKLRVLGRLLGLPGPWDLDQIREGTVAVAPDLTPSFAARMDPAKIVAVATDEGARTSHWAILVRSLRIPAVAGLGSVCRAADDGQAMIVDGRSGRVVLNPDASDRAQFERRRTMLATDPRRAPDGSSRTLTTLDQEPVVLRANLDLPGEAVRAREHGAAGVGLLRTEFLAAGRAAAPDEAEQYAAYRQVAEAFPRQAVIVRTFDLGGDKFPPFLRTAGEKNPFLGRRGVRVYRDEPELLATQLRALLRAAVHGDLRIMVPLVTAPDDLRFVRQHVDEAADDLRRAGTPFAPTVKLGAAVETPAAALLARELAPHADFFSIGTNDLVQYTLAVDRNSRRLATLFDPLHPAVARLISTVSQAGRSADIEVSACGEMAADPSGAALLLGLGVKVLSVAWPSLPEVERLVRRLRIADVRTAAAQAMAAASGPAARRALEACLAETRQERTPRPDRASPSNP